MIDGDVDRNALRQAHPGEDRVHRGEPTAGRGGCVRHFDAAGDACDMSLDHAFPAHQAGARLIAIVYGVQRGFLEIAVDPEGVRVDQRHRPVACHGVVADTRDEVRHEAIHRRGDARAFEVDLGLSEAGERLGDSGIRLLRLAEISLALLFRRAEVGQRQPPLGLGLLVGGVRPRLLEVGLRVIDGNGVVGRLDFHQQVAPVDILVICDGKLDDPAETSGARVTT